MRFVLPVARDALATLNRWSSELKKVNFLTEDSWQLWDLDIKASGTMTITPVDTVAKYKLIGDSLVYFKIQANCTAGGAASNSVYFSLPLPAEDLLIEQFPALIYDGAFNSSQADIYPDIKSLRIFKTSLANITLGNVILRVSGFYQIKQT